MITAAATPAYRQLQWRNAPVALRAAEPIPKIEQHMSLIHIGISVIEPETYLNAAQDIPDQRFQRIIETFDEYRVNRSQAILRVK